MPKKPALTKVPLGFRADPADYQWHVELKDRAGYEGADLLRALYRTLRAACGNDVPDFPFDLSVSVRLKSGKTNTAVYHRDQPEPLMTDSMASARELRVAEDPATPTQLKQPAPPEAQQGHMPESSRLIRD